MFKRIFFPVIAVFFSTTTFSQSEFSGEVNLRGMVSSEEELPFWMHKNQQGRIPENSNISGWITGRANFQLGLTSSLEIGAGGLIHDGLEDQIFLDEAYAHLEAGDFFITAGIKHKEEVYNGLSASNQSILWSRNAREMPGIQIGTNGPVFFNRNDYGFGFEGSLEEYLMEEDRYVSYARVHHKNLFLLFRTADDLQIKAGIRHFALWGGTPEKSETRPETVRDYFKIVTKLGSAATDLADDVGSYEIQVSKDFEYLRVEFLYNYMFETYEGARFSNFPDGRYGIYVEGIDSESIVNSFIYEFYYTGDQNFDAVDNSSENYFNGATYRSGWTYKNRVLGTPFFTLDPDGRGVNNNRMVMHHIGIGGDFFNEFQTYPYRLMVSFGKNKGTFENPYKTYENVLYGSYEMLILQRFVELNVQLAAEFNSSNAPILGVGLHLRKSF